MAVLDLVNPGSPAVAGGLTTLLALALPDDFGRTGLPVSMNSLVETTLEVNLFFSALEAGFFTFSASRLVFAFGLPRFGVVFFFLVGVILAVFGCLTFLT